MATPIINENARDERARNLAAKGFNGLRMALVDLLPAVAPTKARLELFFFNTNHRNDIRDDALPHPTDVFGIAGGRRLPAGPAAGQVQVTAVANGSVPESLYLTVEPIGDYSTYQLGVEHDGVDPFFSDIPFKFRPGCFSADCAPGWEASPAPKPAPVIDYLAKDYDSFRHVMMAAMMRRVPGWKSTSEADFDQVLIDLFAAAGDELSDYQDRVMNEAYLATCRKRLSLARHARLMDYHVHQGNQASTWLALQVNNAFTLEAGFRFDFNFNLLPMLRVWTGGAKPSADSVIFATREKARFSPLLNNLRLYTWDDAAPSLAAGSTEADLVPDVNSPTQADAQAVVDLIRGKNPAQPPVSVLLLQEHLNPATGRLPGRDPAKRQLLRLVVDSSFPAVVRDKVNNRWLVRVQWENADQLRQDYCFTTFCPGAKVEGVSLFHGNLVLGRHGRPAVTTFLEPGTDRPLDDEPHAHRYRYFERTARYGTLCALPDAPLAYLPTAPGGETPPQSSLHVEVVQGGAGADVWDETISLVHSDDSAEEGDHFAVETDEMGRSVLRFGNGVNGLSLATAAEAHCAYQIGGGAAGNVGADALVNFDSAAFPQVDKCWNPFDVTDGRDPEPVEKVLRAAPEAWRARQLRAVTLADYVNRAQEVEGVARAVARHAWTGSWRAVRLVVDPVGTTTLSADLRRRVAEHIEAVRLIGDDIELRPPFYVPLAIEAKVCLDPNYWPEDVRHVLEQEFSDGYTPDGRMGFFHPDNWTFGQPLHRSEIEGRIHRVVGVEHVISITMKRFNDPVAGAGDLSLLEVRTEEIIQVLNDPDHREGGFIDFIIKGGRQ